MPEATERACPVCGSIFTPYRNGDREQVYCSPACGSRADVRRFPERSCEQCSASFRPKDRRSRFCSLLCRDASRRGSAEYQRRLAREGRRPQWSTERRCEVCGKSYRTKNSKARFCSAACFGRSKSKPEPTSCLVPWARCEWCNHWFVQRGVKRFCSVACGYASRCHQVTDIAYGECRRCGSTFVRRRDQVGGFCGRVCAKRADKYRRRHLKRISAGGENFTLREIAERDGWRCHLCGRKVPDREWRARPLDPTIDHLIPTSDDRSSHVRVNVALAHNRCNRNRGATGAAQMRMLG